MNENLTEAARQLLESARLAEFDVQELLNKALEPDYWRSLVPTVDTPVEPDSFTPDELSCLARGYSTEGYFKTKSIFPAELVTRIHANIDLLLSERWPPVFIFVYDELWAMSQSRSLRQLVSAVLGSDYYQNSYVWTHYVRPHKGSAGWPAHIDGNGEKRLSVWIPLTDATLENGCMCVLPKHLVPVGLPADFRDWNTVKQIDLQKILQCSRPLPVPAGSVLGWDHDLIHWGARVTALSAPRVSIALEFVGAGVAAIQSEHPLLQAADLPTFHHRLHIIGKRILEYGRFEPLLNRYSQFAERLVSASSKLPNRTFL